MPIKVLQVFGSLNMGGAESRMMDVYRQIDRNEYRFDFLTLQQSAQYYEVEIQQLGGKVIKISPPRESGTLRNLREMTEIMAGGGYAAVHAHTSFHCGAAMLAAKRAGIPIRISHSRTTGSKHSGVLAKARLGIGRLMIRTNATCRLAISKEAGQYLFGSSEYHVLPNAIDLSRYTAVSEEEIEACRREAELRQGDFVIGLVGRLDRMKNHSFALRLLSEILKEKPNARLVLIGEGPLRSELEAQTNSMELNDKVHFMGVRRDVPVWMKLFDVLIVPSLFEGLGGVILEAQAAGTPVVKADCFTNASDLSLGLISQCSLDSIPDWIAAIERNPMIPDEEEILQTFERKGYTLSAEIDALSRCYRGEQLGENT